MALPLKSGADLYTQELLRARLHNFDGDLAEYGTGSIYFNTTSGLNTSDRIRYRGLTNWHSVANLEDIARLEEMIGNLDFAGSEDFIGITSRVAALEGNFTNGAAKDAVKFGGQLPSYYATQSAFSALQDKVNAFLDGDVDSDAVLENLKEIQTFLDSYDGATSLFDLLNTKLSEYLPLSGGELNGGLIIKNGSGLYFKDTSGKGILALYVNSANKLILGAGTKETGLSTYIEGTNVYINNSIALHTGNIRDYAFSPQTQITNNTDADTLLTNGVYLNATGNGSGNSNFPSEYSILMTFTQDKNYSAQISVGNNSIHVRRKIDAWSDWKTVAFTDSDITGYAAGLKHSNGTVGAVLNSHGNVTIGASDLAGENNKLFVNGIQSIKSDISKGVAELNATAGNANVWNGNGNSHFTIANNNNRMSFFVGGIANEKKASIQVGHINPAYGNAIGSLCLNPFGGSVGIGTANPLQKLHVAGNILLRNYDSIRFFKTDGTTQVELLTLNSDNETVLGGDANYYSMNTVVKGYRTIIKTGTYNTSALIIDENCNAAIPYRLLVGNPTDSGWIPFQVKGAADIDGPLYISAHTKEGIYLNEVGIHWHNTSAGWVSALVEFSSSAVRLSKPTTVAGDLHVEGNIIADGQVSSGGVAEEGTGVSGSLERVTFTIPSGTTSFECEHNLGTKEISVSIYEEGGDYQQILADVYLDSTNIARIVFGRSTDVAHKVVIIG